MPQPIVPQRRAAVLILLFLLLAATAAGSALYYFTARAALRKSVYQQLAAVAELKVSQARRWRDERRREARMDAAGVKHMPAVRRLLSGETTGGARAVAESWLAALRAEAPHQSYALTDARGRIVAAAGEMEESVERAGAECAASGKVYASDFQKSGATGGIRLYIAAPFPGGAERNAAGCLVLGTDPRRALFPQLQSWPVPSASAETLLVRRDGNDALYLNDLRHARGAALTLRLPLSRTDVPAVKGLLGDPGPGAGPDYRGVPVYAVSQPVPESGWLVVAKIDRSEAEAHLVGETILVAAVGGGLSLVALMAFLFFQRRRLARYYSELYEAESERRLLADTIAASLNEIYLFDAETYRFRFANAGALQNLGYTLEEIRNLTPLKLQAEFSKADFEDLAGPLKRGETALQQFDTVHRRKDGSRYPVKVRLQLIARGQEKVFLAVILNIGEKRLLEEQLREAQRLESIGRLAGGVAHDFNNYLTVINGFSDLLLPAFEPADPRHNRLLMIRHAGEQAANLTRQLLAFSRRQILKIQPVCLNSVIRSIRPLLRRLVREDLELAEALADDLGLVPADAAQMGQVVMNLVLNGRDAIPGAGRILIETANVELGAAQVAKRPGVEAGAYVMLAVTDTGEGMRAEVMSRVFEPFYTTKEQGHGTGLGLAAVHGIVRQCEGWIWVYSEPGKGSTFKVYLPRTAGSAAGRTAAAPLAASLVGTETILVVEDQDEVREITCAVLREHGYRVLRASHGEDALQVASGFPGAIDLLVTDVVMPGMNGRELARALAGIRPEMKVIYVSGYTSNVVAHHGVLEPGVHYLPKPFAPQALATMVRAVLSGGES